MVESASVLFVHGLWMTGAEGLLLRQRLGAYGLSVTTFRYGTTFDRLADVIVRLAQAIREQGPGVRLLGHSLGGLMLLRCLADHPTLEIGPVVLMGCPVNGSLAAQGLARIPGAGWLLGEAAAELLHEDARHWRRHSPLGVIAGDVGIGFAALIADLPSPHDGAISVEEARLRGASDYRTYQVNHMGLLTSASVARGVAGFLNSGRFTD